MFHECLQKTNSLSLEKIQQINFMLKNPLNADFSLLTPGKASGLIAEVSNLQRQCRFEIKNEAPCLPAIGATRFQGHTRSSKSMWSRKISVPSNMQQAKMTTVEMIKEDLHRLGCAYDELDLQTVNRLTALYLLTESLILLECGVCELTQRGQNFILQKTKKFDAALHTHWFCNLMTFMSKRSDIVDMQKLIHQAHSSNQSVLQLCCQNPAFLTHITIVQVDKTLSLNFRFFYSLPTQSHKAIEDFMERARIATLLYLIWIEALEAGLSEENPPLIKLTHAALAQLEISQHTWSEMLTISEKKPAHDKLIIFLGADTYQPGPLSLDQMLVQYCGKALEKLGSLFGKWFEEEYIYSCIQDEVPDSRYRVHSGGKAKQRMKEKYDIDLIIEDVEADRLLLCQVKYRHNADLPFFRSHWQEFFLGDMIQGGLRQLKALSDSLDDPALIDMIRTRTGRNDITTDYLKNKSSLVLLHNVNSLGFGQFDGILLYDWPSFRNLLRRRIGVSFIKEQNSSTKTYSIRIPLESIEKTIAHLCEHVLNHPNANNLKDEWNLFSRAVMEIEWHIAPIKNHQTRIRSGWRRVIAPFF